MAATVHTHQASADFESDCRSAWNCVRATTSDRISSAEELKYGEIPSSYASAEQVDRVHFHCSEHEP